MKLPKLLGQKWVIIVTATVTALILALVAYQLFLAPHMIDLVDEGMEVRVSGAYDGCRITGCSGEVCADEEVITICIFKIEFACYQDIGICERGQDGECGWRQTSELEQCITAARL